MPNRIFKQRKYLIGIVDGAATDADLELFQSELSDMVGDNHSTAVIVDVGQLDVIDSFTGHSLNHLAKVLTFRGAEAMIVGIRPEVAFAMVSLGLSLDGIATAIDLDSGLDLFDAKYAVGS